MQTSYALPVRSVSKRLLRSGLPLALLCALGSGNPAAYGPRAAAHAASGSKRSAARQHTVCSAAGREFGARDSAAQSNRSFDPSALVSIDAKNANLATLIDLLMEQAHASYTLSQKLTTAPVGNVKLRRVTFQAALEAILKMSDVAVMYRVETGIFRIIPRSDVEARPTATAATTVTAASTAEAGNLFDMGVRAGAAGYDKRDSVVSIGVSDVTLYDALKMVFGQAKVNYTLDPALRAMRVSVAMSNVPLRMAVDTLLRTTGNNNLTLRVENGIYKVDATGRKDAAPAVKP